MGTLDGIIDTASAPHSINPLVGLLKRDGKLILLGAPDLERPLELQVFPLIMGKFLILKIKCEFFNSSTL